jgi:predicted methyltransferase
MDGTVPVSVLASIWRSDAIWAVMASLRAIVASRSRSDSRRT